MAFTAFWKKIFDILQNCPCMRVNQTNEYSFLLLCLCLWCFVGFYETNKNKINTRPNIFMHMHVFLRFLFLKILKIISYSGKKYSTPFLKFMLITKELFQYLFYLHFFSFFLSFGWRLAKKTNNNNDKYCFCLSRKRRTM